MNPSEDPFSFGTTFVVSPTAAHTHTAIVLHGRGDTGEDFADEFLSSKLSDGKSLQALLPEWRWVFPSAPVIWSTAFQEDMPAWFEAHSLSDPSARQELQTPGLLASVDHVSRVIVEEFDRLGGDAGKVVLGGISQGGAVALLTLLSGRVAGMGGFFAASTWLPFASDVEDALLHGVVSAETNTESRDAIPRLLASTSQPDAADRRAPALLSHGTDDAYVDIGLGREAALILRMAGHEVTCKEYTGAEQEGHWFKEPEGIDDVFFFLGQVARG